MGISGGIFNVFECKIGGESEIRATHPSQTVLCSKNTPQKHDRLLVSIINPRKSQKKALGGAAVGGLQPDPAGGPLAGDGSREKRSESEKTASQT